jgi:hypothetical protein
MKTVSIFNLVTPKFPYKKTFAFGSAVLIALFLYFIFGYKDYINKLVHHDGQWLYYSNNKILISKDQSKTIELLEKKGQFSSAELNKIISKNKSYAKSHIAYQNLTNFDEPLINSTKNPSDKRQIIYFAGNKIFKKKSFFEYVFKK